MIIFISIAHISCFSLWFNTVHSMFPKIVSRSDTTTAHAHAVKHLNNSWLRNTTPSIFHIYKLAEQPAPQKLYNIYNLFCPNILFIQNIHILNS